METIKNIETSITEKKEKKTYLTAPIKNDRVYVGTSKTGKEFACIVIEKSKKIDDTFISKECILSKKFIMPTKNGNYIFSFNEEIGNTFEVEIKVKRNKNGEKTFETVEVINFNNLRKKLFELYALDNKENE